MTAIPNNFELVRTLVEKLLAARGLPYRLSINHNVGPPKNEACPLDYDWRHGREVGIDTCDRLKAAKWIGAALHYGYRVSRLDKHGYDAIEVAHMKSARERAIRQAKRDAMTPEQRKAELDEIPF